MQAAVAVVVVVVVAAAVVAVAVVVVDFTFCLFIEVLSSSDCIASNERLSV
jgi:hypothetical protein